MALVGRRAAGDEAPHRISIIFVNPDYLDEAFAKILSNNIISNNTLATLVAPQMAERKDGAIIIISSIGGLRASTE